MLLLCESRRKKENILWVILSNIHSWNLLCLMIKVLLCWQGPKNKNIRIKIILVAFFLFLNFTNDHRIIAWELLFIRWKK